MEQEKILDFLKTLPEKPGCYQFIGAENKILYIGKARSLKDRVKQYFVNSSDNRFFISKLPPLLEDIRIIITSSEKEALILEAELIRRHKPPFNVELKDDKRFLSIRIDRKAVFPQLELVRKRADDKALYFGPFANAAAIKNTISLIKCQFGLRTCSDHQFQSRLNKWQQKPKVTRPCLQYDLKRCLAPCCGKCQADEYQQAVDNVVELLEGNTSALIKKLTATMEKLATAFKYEEAAKVRDQIIALKRSLESQAIVLPKKTDADIYATVEDASGTAIALLEVRRGVIHDLHTHYQSDLLDGSQEAVAQYIRWWYYTKEPPTIICTPEALPWQEEITQELCERYQRKITIAHPSRGLFANLQKKALENAKQALLTAKNRPEVYELVAATVAKMLGLPKIPHYLECIDISQLQATNVVGVTVAFFDGLPDKKNYRHYKIQGATDDFAAVYEVVRRRVDLHGHNLPPRLPDLLVIDGGRGQLAAAMAALADSNMTEQVPLVAMAKARTAPTDYRENNQARQYERLFLPGRKNPIILKPGSAIERLFVQLRDATHHSAITFHRSLRAKNTTKSILDNIPGLGPVKRRSLLTTFGSVAKIAQASVGEIAAIPGINQELASTILAVVREI